MVYLPVPQILICQSSHFFQVLETVNKSINSIFFLLYSNTPQVGDSVIVIPQNAIDCHQVTQHQ